MRETALQVRMFETEKQALKWLATAKGVSLSDYVRLRINEDYEAVKERIDRYSTERVSGEDRI